MGRCESDTGQPDAEQSKGFGYANDLVDSNEQDDKSENIAKDFDSIIEVS